MVVIVLCALGIFYGLFHLPMPAPRQYFTAMACVLVFALLLILWVAGIPVGPRVL